MRVVTTMKDIRNVTIMRSLNINERDVIDQHVCKLNDLSKYDIFYMEEADGELVRNDKGQFIAKATSEPYVNDIGVNTIEVEMI